MTLRGVPAKYDMLLELLYSIFFLSLDAFV